jgi:hypothetical protein
MLNSTSVTSTSTSVKPDGCRVFRLPARTEEPISDRNRRAVAGKNQRKAEILAGTQFQYLRAFERDPQLRQSPGVIASEIDCIGYIVLQSGRSVLGRRPLLVETR